MRYLIHCIHTLSIHSTHSMRAHIVEYPAYYHIFWDAPRVYMILTGTHCISKQQNVCILVYNASDRVLHPECRRHSVWGGWCCRLPHTHSPRAPQCSSTVGPLRLTTMAACRLQKVMIIIDYRPKARSYCQSFSTNIIQSYNYSIMHPHLLLHY